MRPCTPLPTSSTYTYGSLTTTLNTKTNSSTTDETYKSNTIKQSIAQSKPYFSANPNFLHRHVERRFVSQQTCYVQVHIKLTSRSTMIMEITETMMAAVQILHHELTIVRRGVNHRL